MRGIYKYFILLFLLFAIAGCNQATTTAVPTTSAPTTELTTTSTASTASTTQTTLTTITSTTITTTEEVTTIPYLESVVENLVFVLEVEDTFYLPAFIDDIQASWETTDTDHITIADELTFRNEDFFYEVSVTRPSYVEGDQVVTITGHFTDSVDEYTKNFNFLVLAFPAMYYLEKDLELIEETYIVETEFALPVLEYSTYSNIVISAELLDYISYSNEEFTIVRPNNDITATISFDVTYGNAFVNVEIEIILLAEPTEITYTENFSWVTSSSTAYATAFSNTDENGFEWSLFGRGDLDYFTFGNSADGSYAQVTATGGISSFSIDMVRAFTNANIRSAELFINGVSYGVFMIDVASDVWQNFTVQNINISGNVVIKLVSTSPGTRGAFKINNFTWTTYTEEEIE